MSTRRTKRGNESRIERLQVDEVKPSKHQPSKHMLEEDATLDSYPRIERSKSCRSIRVR